MGEELVQAERRPRCAPWFRRSPAASALALADLGRVRVIAAGGRVLAPVLPDYALPHVDVPQGSLLACLPRSVTTS